MCLSLTDNQVRQLSDQALQTSVSAFLDLRPDGFALYRRAKEWPFWSLQELWTHPRIGKQRKDAGKRARYAPVLAGQKRGFWYQRYVSPQTEFKKSQLETGSPQDPPHKQLQLLASRRRTPHQRVSSGKCQHILHRGVPEFHSMRRLSRQRICLRKACQHDSRPAA